MSSGHEGSVGRSNRTRWIGVDFDGSLATYEKGQGSKLGAPIAPMVKRVKKWLAQCEDVRIFTARASTRNDTENLKWGESEWNSDDQRRAIEAWCETHLGRVLPITAEKDFMMKLLVDDRAVGVEHNTGRVLDTGAALEMLWAGNADHA